MINASILNDSKIQIRLSDGTTPGDGDFNITSIRSGTSLRANVKNMTDKPVRIKEIALFAGEISLPDDTCFYGEGYHMLSQYRGELKTNSMEVIGAYGDDKSFFFLPDNPHDRDLNIVYYLLEYKSQAGNALLSFASCHKFIGKFRLKGNYLEAVMDTEDIYLYPGQTWDMEELVIHTGSVQSVLYDKLAADINRNHPPFISEKIPTGWCSYYCLGQMTPEGLYQNAESMAKRIPELEMIQIDSGLQTTDGDWLVPRFNDDLATACKKVREKGVTPGGYFAPFLVDFSSEFYKNRKDLLIKDEQGNPTNRLSHKKDWCILDGTHPEAREFLREIVRYMRDDCGLRYFKLDFLSYGALPAGKHWDETKTSVEAYRMGMKAIIEEAGEDSFILACNAPFWPTLGLAHGNRSTNDIFRDWKHVQGNALEQFYRNWQHRKLWINDPDCIVLEKLDIVRMKNEEPVIKPCTLTDDEFEFHKAFGIACGGMILSGDLLNEISDKNIDVLKKMMANMGEAAIFDDDSFEIGRFPTKKMLCLFNWGTEEKNIFVTNNGMNSYSDLWTGDILGSFKGRIEITLPPHSGRVLHFEPGKELN